MMNIPSLWRRDPPEQRSRAPEQRNANLPPSSTVWRWITGGPSSDSGEIVTPQTAMGLSTVNACVRLISESIASLSPILYEKTATGKKEATGNPLHRILSLEPNPDSTAFSLWDSFVASIALWGNGYLEIERSQNGTILGLWFLHPSSVSPERLKDGSLAYRVSQGGNRLLPAADVIHVPWHSIDGVTGISVIAQSRGVFGSHIAMEKFGGRFFANSATPSGILSTAKTVRAEDKNRMRTDWEAMQSGTNQHRVAVLDQELEFKPIGIPNADAQWIEARKMGREEICGLFKLHPSQIGSESRVAGETYAAQQLGFLNQTLRPWLNRIEQELRRKLLPGLPQYDISHDVSDLLRLDIKSQMDAFAVARQWGVLTANQCRKILELDPGPPECDLYWRPVNMVDAATPAPQEVKNDVQAA